MPIARKSEPPINQTRQALMRGAACFRRVDLRRLREELGISRQFLNRVINGQRKSARVERALCKACGLTRKGLPSE